MDSMIWFTAFIKWFIGTFVVLLEYHTMQGSKSPAGSLWYKKNCQPVSIAFARLFYISH